jgi:hypothetical protein
MTERKPFATGGDHPEEWQRDLNPEAGAGLNYGLMNSDAEKNAPVAFDMKYLHERFPELSGDDLKQLPILPPDTQLQQGATYLDLNDRQEFTARADMVSGPGNLYVAKTEVDYQLWNRLRGVTNPERTGNADE